MLVKRWVLDMLYRLLKFVSGILKVKNAKCKRCNSQFCEGTDCKLMIRM